MRAYVRGMRRKRRSARRRPLIGRRPTAGSGAAKASPPSRYRSASTVQTAFFGAGPRAGLIPSTVATCRWRGGRGRESAPAARRTRFKSPDRGRSGARPKAPIFAPRDCRAIQANRRARPEAIDPTSNARFEERARKTSPRRGNRLQVEGCGFVARALADWDLDQFRRALRRSKTNFILTFTKPRMSLQIYLTCAS